MAVLWTGRAVRRRPVLNKETLSVQAAVAAAATGRVLLCVGLAVPWTGCVCDGVHGQRRCWTRAQRAWVAVLRTGYAVAGKGKRGQRECPGTCGGVATHGTRWQGSPCFRLAPRPPQRRCHTRDERAWVWERRCGRHSGGGRRAVDRQRVMGRCVSGLACVLDPWRRRVAGSLDTRVQGGRRGGHGGRAPRGPAGARPRSGAGANGSNPPGAAAGRRRPVLKKRSGVFRNLSHRIH